MFFVVEPDTLSDINRHHRQPFEGKIVAKSTLLALSPTPTTPTIGLFSANHPFFQENNSSVHHPPVFAGIALSSYFSLCAFASFFCVFALRLFLSLETGNFFCAPLQRFVPLCPPKIAQKPPVAQKTSEDTSPHTPRRHQPSFPHRFGSKHRQTPARSSKSCRVTWIRESNDGESICRRGGSQRVLKKPSALPG
jgi:hypothetical protein